MLLLLKNFSFDFKNAQHYRIREGENGTVFSNVWIQNCFLPTCTEFMFCSGGLRASLIQRQISTARSLASSRTAFSRDSKSFGNTLMIGFREIIFEPNSLKVKNMEQHQCPGRNKRVIHFLIFFFFLKTIHAMLSVHIQRLYHLLKS